VLSWGRWSAHPGLPASTLANATVGADGAALTYVGDEAGEIPSFESGRGSPGWTVYRNAVQILDPSGDWEAAPQLAVDATAPCFNGHPQSADLDPALTATCPNAGIPSVERF
jgi:hypothetical protein